MKVDCPDLLGRLVDKPLGSIGAWLVPQVPGYRLICVGSGEGVKFAGSCPTLVSTSAGEPPAWLKPEASNYHQVDHPTTATLDTRFFLFD